MDTRYPTPNLASMPDVAISSPTNGQALTYDSASGKWKNSTAGAGDMLKATYDANNDGVVDNAAALGGTSAATITNSIAAKLPLAGGTMAGNIAMGSNHVTGAARVGFDAGAGPYLYADAMEVPYWHFASSPSDVAVALLDSSSRLSNYQLAAANLYGSVPKAALGAIGTPNLGGTIRDLHLDSTNPVAWKASGFNIDIGGRVVSAECLTSGEATLQSFTLRSSFLAVPSGFTAYKTAGAFAFSLVADDTSNANARLTGYSIIGYNDRESTGTTILTASGLTTGVTSASVPKVVSVDVAAFATTDVFTWVVVEFELSVRSSKCLTVADFKLSSE